MAQSHYNTGGDSGRADMRDLVDLSVCIEVPMEVALARRLLDATEKWSGSAEERMQWMNSYLKTYLFEGMREVYVAINERVKERSDLVLDGTQTVAHNAQRVSESVQARR